MWIGVFYCESELHKGKPALLLSVFEIKETTKRLLQLMHCRYLFLKNSEYRFFGTTHIALVLCNQVQLLK